MVQIHARKKNIKTSLFFQKLTSYLCFILGNHRQPRQSSRLLRPHQTLQAPATQHRLVGPDRHLPGLLQAEQVPHPVAHNHARQVQHLLPGQDSRPLQRRLLSPAEKPFQNTQTNQQRLPLL